MLSLMYKPVGNVPLQLLPLQQLQMELCFCPNSYHFLEFATKMPFTDENGLNQNGLPEGPGFADWLAALMGKGYSLLEVPDGIREKTLSPCHPLLWF